MGISLLGMAACLKYAGILLEYHFFHDGMNVVGNVLSEGLGFLGRGKCSVISWRVYAAYTWDNTRHYPPPKALAVKTSKNTVKELRQWNTY